MVLLLSLINIGNARLSTDSRPSGDYVRGDKVKEFPHWAAAPGYPTFEESETTNGWECRHNERESRADAGRLDKEFGVH
jgi:hypothetical protein